LEQVIKHSINSVENLVHLPTFARYILKNKLDSWVDVQIKYLREFNVPLLQKFTALPESEFVNITKKSSVEYLTSLSKNKAREEIENSIRNWRENQLPNIDKEEIKKEDISLISFIRKKTFLHFIPEYTSDNEHTIALIQEVDLCIFYSESEATDTYIDLLKKRISEHTHFIEKINKTSPSAIYVFDIINNKGVYESDKVASIFGYNQKELNQKGLSAMEELIHPDDKEIIRKHMQEMQYAEDGEIKSYKYRLLYKGAYKWIRHYESVFKRTPEGRVWQLIVTALDVDKEKKIAEQLKQSEMLYKQAQSLAHLGNWYWDIKTDNLQWSDELYRIYELEPGTPISNLSMQAHNHPDDQPMINKAIKQSLETLQPYDFYYRVELPGGTKKTLHVKGQPEKDKEGKCCKLHGTVQDVTERENLLDQLKSIEFQYKQAEEMVSMGNWNYNPVNGEINWTDQLYKIYGMEPKSENITLEKFFSFIHPEDIEVVLEDHELLGKVKILDRTFRIITRKGQMKTLRSIAQSQYDDSGKLIKIIGTERDITERQSLIDRLKHSEDLFNQAQSLAHIGNWSWDFRTEKLIWSDELYRIFGLLPESRRMDFKTYVSLLHPTDRAMVKETVEESIKTKKPYQFYHKILLKDGTVKVVHSRGSVSLDKQDKPYELVGTAQDVTEQHRIQQELKDNQNFIRKITDAAPSIISSYNIKTGKYAYISGGLTKLLGYNVAEVLQKGTAFFNDIIHPDDMEEVMNKHLKALEEANADPSNNSMIVEFTYRMRHRDGMYKWFQTYGTIFDRNEEGHVENILNISHDITDRITAEERIAEQDLFIQHLADASPTILYLFDVQKNSIAYVNKEIFFVLGYTTDEIIGMGAKVIPTLYHPEEYALLPQRRESDRSFQHRNSMIQYECRIRHKNKEWKWMLTREVIFKTDDAGKPLQILGAALDITNRKEMERSIVNNSHQLEQSNASLEEFAYVASHDLKEPLRKISTFGDRLINTQLDRLNEDGKIYLNKIVDASQRMQTMINDLLSISLISGDRSFQIYSLQTILEDAMQALEIKIEQKNALIIGESLPEANIVPSQFRQLFQNLLSNSLKFAKDDVQPVVKITSKYISAEETAPYQLAHNGRCLRVVFEDNGIGFEEEYAGKIFQIFQRLHGRSHYEGTGIGLAICKKIAEHHGGIIYALGKPNEGSVFTIVLPA
jgi:PAS domain S-box-containing protein